MRRTDCTHLSTHKHVTPSLSFHLSLSLCVFIRAAPVVARDAVHSAAALRARVRESAVLCRLGRRQGPLEEMAQVSAMLPLPL